VTYSDSSFLVSLYVDDEHNKAANAYLRRNPSPILLTSFGKSETQHALRLLAFRRQITEMDMTRHLLTFERDQDEGFFEVTSIDFPELLSKASQISHRHTLAHGLRYLDVLHIASAVTTKAKRFLTFDLRQRKLAAAIGLDVKI
jgi:predicted nucleic acid-binding protein